MNLDSVDLVFGVFPDRHLCAYLKMDDATGMVVGGEIVRMGTCAYRGGDCYDAECSGCSAYRRYLRWPPWA